MTQRLAHFLYLRQESFLPNSLRKRFWLSHFVLQPSIDRRSLIDFSPVCCRHRRWARTAEVEQEARKPFINPDSIAWFYPSAMARPNSTSWRLFTRLWRHENNNSGEKETGITRSRRPNFQVPLLLQPASKTKSGNEVVSYSSGNAKRSAQRRSRQIDARDTLITFVVPGNCGVLARGSARNFCADNDKRSLSRDMRASADVWQRMKVRSERLVPTHETTIFQTKRTHREKQNQQT